MFRMDFMDNVVGPSLYNAYSGARVGSCLRDSPVWRHCMQQPVGEVRACTDHRPENNWHSVRQRSLALFPSTWETSAIPIW